MRIFSEGCGVNQPRAVSIEYSRSLAHRLKSVEGSPIGNTGSYCQLGPGVATNRTVRDIVGPRQPLGPWDRLAPPTPTSYTLPVVFLFSLVRQ
jgi:hypothetical protein